MLNRADSDYGGAVPADGRKTRREALGVMASAGALAMHRVDLTTAAIDPVLGAIDRHKAAWSAVGALCSVVDEVAAVREGRQIAKTDLVAYQRASAIAEQRSTKC